MKVNCSNCQSLITINVAAEAAQFTTPAHGRASLRVQEHTVSNPLSFDSNGLVVWESPCCTDAGEPYIDSIEPWEYPLLKRLIETNV